MNALNFRVNSLRSFGLIAYVRRHASYFNSNGTLTKNVKDVLYIRKLDIDTVDWDAVESIFVLLGIANLISITILILECYIFEKLSEKFDFKKTKEKYFFQYNKAFNEVFKCDLKIEDLE